MSYAIDNGHSDTAAAIRGAGGEATYADKGTKIKELTERLMNEYPDYKKSTIKHAQPKITLFGEKITKK